MNLTTPSTENKPWFQVLILSAFGTYLGYVIVSGNLDNYINERFAWLTYLAVALFFAMAGFTMFRTLKPAPDSAYTISEPQKVTWTVLSIVALPLIFGVFIPSKPLGAEAINGSISTSAVADSTVSGFSIPSEQRNILDWLREFNRVEDYNILNGQPADVVGFVYREPDFPEDEFMLARFTVSCCVADASALGLPVKADNAAEFQTGDWVHLTGVVQVDDFNGEPLPVVYPDSLQVVEVPSNPYLYP